MAVQLAKSWLLMKELLTIVLGFEDPEAWSYVIITFPKANFPKKTKGLTPWRGIHKWCNLILAFKKHLV